MSASNSSSESPNPPEKTIARAFQYRCRRNQQLLAAAATSLLVGTARAQSNSEISLPTIQVDTTSRSNADTQSYVAPHNTTATKTNTPWIETPQSVSTVTAEQMRDQKPMSLSEVVNYSPGVRGGTFGEDFRNDWFLLRGFTAQNEAIFLDGMQLFSTSYATWKLMPFALQSLDILRGPSSALVAAARAASSMPRASCRPSIRCTPSRSA
jgi:iron complex outermembrane recepter protein